MKKQVNPYHNEENPGPLRRRRECQFYTYPERIEKATQELRANYPGNFWTEYIGGRIEGQMRGAPSRKYTDLSMPTPFRLPTNKPKQTAA